MIDPNITIVTAFFDIGRGHWNTGPSYLKRSVEDYFTNFERLLKLKNQIIVHTSRDLEDRFRKYQYDYSNLTVIGWEDWRKNIWPEFFKPIQEVQNREDYKNMILQPWNPEYWSVDYIMVNMLKSYFVNYSIELGLAKNDLVAWIDFGYAKKENDVPTNIWSYNFDPETIHLFTIKQNCPPHMDVIPIIQTNDVWITGCHIVASKQNWKELLGLVYANIELLLKHNLIDDDQTILMMCYCSQPSLFQIHYIDDKHPSGWFQMFHIFNDASFVQPL